MKKLVCKECGSEDISIVESLNPNDDTTIRGYFTDAYGQDGGQCFCDACLDYQKFEVIDVPDEKPDPWRCSVCGSKEVQQRAWVDINDGEVIHYDDCDRNDFYCLYCDGHNHIVRESKLMKDIEVWWQQTDFETMEVITGLQQDDFDPADGYQAFVEACEGKWNALGVEEKIHIWHELTRDKSNDSE